MWQQNAPFTISALLLAAVLSPVSVTAAEPLRWKLEPKDRLRAVTEQTVETETSYTGTAVQSTLNLLVETEWEVKAVNEGKIDLSQKVTRARIEMQSPKTDSVVYDSRDEKRPTGAARQLYNSIQPLIGRTAQVTMSDRGEILAVELPSSDQSPTEATDKKSNTAGAPAVSSEVLKSLLSKPLLVLPKEAVDAGETWQASDTGEATVGPVAIDKTFKLAEVEEADNGELATIAGSGKISLKSSSTNLKLAESDYSQTVVFDVKEGRVTSSEQKVRLRTEKPYRETTIVTDVTVTEKTTIEPAK